jgi:hypothetical protein
MTMDATLANTTENPSISLTKISPQIIPTEIKRDRETEKHML